MATTKAQYNAKSKAEMFHILRREILAARLKITVDKKSGRPTSEKVRRLAAMELPPIISENLAPAARRGNEVSQQLLDRLDQNPRTRLLTATEMTAYTDRDPSWPAEAAQQHQLIAATHAGMTLYPAFQIDPDPRTPRDWVPTIVALLHDAEFSGRSFVLWAASPSQRFGGEAPADHASDPDFVVKAAGDLADL